MIAKQPTSSLVEIDVAASATAASSNFKLWSVLSRCERKRRKMKWKTESEGLNCPNSAANILSFAQLRDCMLMNLSMRCDVNEVGKRMIEGIC